MTNPPSVNELLLRWYEAQEQGRPVSPEELCGDCPELLESVRRGIDALLSMEGMLRSPRTLAEGMTDGPSTVPIAPPEGGGEAVPGYEILSVLGQGGMGVVYKARQRVPQRLVALKMIRGHVGPGALARFRAEADALARLRHPQVVPVYEVGEHDGAPYFAMELVEGGSLADRLKPGPLPARTAALLVESLARALHAVHQQQILHRDIKPHNILLAGEPDSPLEKCLPKLSDFGLAKRLDQEESLTPTGPSWARPPTCLPSKRGARTAPRSTSGPTCIPWEQSCTVA
jgi:serine/threonine-protein kinase